MSQQNAISQVYEDVQTALKHAEKLLKSAEKILKKSTQGQNLHETLRKACSSYLELQLANQAFRWNWNEELHEQLEALADGEPLAVSDVQWQCAVVESTLREKLEWVAGEEHNFNRDSISLMRSYFLRIAEDFRHSVSLDGKHCKQQIRTELRQVKHALRYGELPA